MVTVRITSLARLSWGGVRGRLPVASAAGCISLGKGVPNRSRLGLSRKEREELGDSRELVSDFTPGGEYARHSCRRNQHHISRNVE